jgi:glycosyltransferase involved in cell wall biosynthesis
MSGDRAGEDAARAARPVVTVVIPSFNAAKTLSATLDSVLGQTIRDVEVVVVDDGSSDGTPEVLASYAAQVRGIRQANGGLARARNAGLAVARGEFIALLDADDVCEPQRLEVQLAVLRELPEVVLCGSDFVGFDAAGPVAQCSLASYYSIVAQTAGGLRGLLPHGRTIVAGAPAASYAVHFGPAFRSIARGNFVHPPTVLFRRELLQTVGEFDAAFVNGCDYDWLLRAARAGAFAVIGAPLLRYRLSPGQMSGSRNQHVVLLDVLRSIESIRRTDPAVYRSDRRHFRARQRSCLLGAASSLADVDRGRAWAALARSLGFGPPGLDSVRIAAKISAPRAVAEWLRARRSREAE